MATEYYLNSGNQKLGPFSEGQIVSGIRSGKISLFDNIYNKQLGEWVMIMQHPDFCDLDSSTGGEEEESDSSEAQIQVGLAPEEFGNTKTVLPLDFGAEVAPDLERPYWYEKSQPGKGYKFLDVVSLLHSREFSEHTLISKSPEGPWKPLIEWDDFSPKSLAEFQANAKEDVPDVVIRRKHPRFDCGKNFILVAQGKAFKAFCPDISKSGMSFIVRTLKATMNESLFIKFGDALGDATFDAKGVVVGIRKIRVTDTGAVYIRYALRFTHLSEHGKKMVASMTAKTSKG